MGSKVPLKTAHELTKKIAAQDDSAVAEYVKQQFLWILGSGQDPLDFELVRTSELSLENGAKVTYKVQEVDNG